MSISGGCICGGCRYEIDEEINGGFICQCTDCQKTTGTGHSVFAVVKRKNLELKGKTKSFERKMENGNVLAHVFCETCGNPLINQSSGYPDICFVLIGSLDDPSIFKPGKVVYRESGHAWDLNDPEG
jgi:hypothetical protein